MARPKTPILTPAELRLMEVLWDQPNLTVAEVRTALPGRERPAYNTVLTTLRILEEKGYVDHAKHSRAHIFRPLVTRVQARSQALRNMVGSFFRGSPTLLLRSMLQDEKLSAAELQQIKKLIRENAGD